MCLRLHNICFAFLEISKMAMLHIENTWLHQNVCVFRCIFFLLLCGVTFELECTTTVEHKYDASAKCLTGFLATEMPERILTRMSIQQQKIGFSKLMKQFTTFSFTHYNRMIPFSLALFISPNGVIFLHHVHVPRETDPPVCYAYWPKLLQHVAFKTCFQN